MAVLTSCFLSQLLIPSGVEDGLEFECSDQPSLNLVSLTWSGIISCPGCCAFGGSTLPLRAAYVEPDLGTADASEKDDVPTQ